MGPQSAKGHLGAATAGLKLREEVLSPRQHSVLRRLTPFLSASPFYLAGGTALALQLGHRRSVDFDWFSEDPIDDPLRLASEIGAAGAPLVVDRTEKGTLHGTVGRVRVTFLEYRYPLLRPPLKTAAGLRLASLEDIACMKLAAVAQRGSKKDFVDLYALGRHLSLAEMLRLYRRKYAVIDPGHLLFALSFFDDADAERLPTMLRPCEWAVVKKTVRGWVTQAAR